MTPSSVEPSSETVGVRPGIVLLLLSVLALTIVKCEVRIILLLGIVRLRLSLHLAINILEEGDRLNETAGMVSTSVR